MICWKQLQKQYQYILKDTVYDLIKLCRTSVLQMTKWKCSVCCSHSSVLSSCMTYHKILNKSYMTGVTSGAGTAYPSWVPEFTFRGSYCLILRGSLIVFLSFIFWPLHCLFFDLQLLMTLFVYSAFSCLHKHTPLAISFMKPYNYA